MPRPRPIQFIEWRASHKKRRLLSALGHFRQIGAVATLRGCPLRPESGHWELSTLRSCPQTIAHTGAGARCTAGFQSGLCLLRVISRRSSMPWPGLFQPCKRTYASDLSNVGAAGEIFPDWLAARLLAAGMKTSWLQTALARSSRGPPISHWDGFLASLRLGPHACDCCTLESALGLTECERSVKWL